MISDWLNNIIKDFGVHLGLSQFRLNERESAAVRFENGIRFCIEHNGEQLFLYTSCPMGNQENELRELLQAAHYENHYPFPIRIAYQTQAQNAVFLTNIADRDVSIPLLDNIFQTLWQLALHYLNK